MSGQPARQKVESRSPAERLWKFTSTTVHHLREPARTIAIYSEMLQSDLREGSADNSKRTAQLIAGAAEKLQGLLESLSEFAAVSAESSPVMANVPLNLVLRHALQQLDTEAQAGNAKISVSPLPDVSGDFDRLLVVFRHLIRNAIRYRGEAAPEIVIEARQANQEWVIEVRDNGPGIAPEYRDRVFEPYMRLHGNERPGHGLGLTVCRAIIENHGGHMWVESSRTGGAAFRFTLPAQAPA